MDNNDLFEKIYRDITKYACSCMLRDQAHAKGLIHALYIVAVRCNVDEEIEAEIKAMEFGTD